MPKFRATELEIGAALSRCGLNGCIEMGDVENCLTRGCPCTALGSKVEAALNAAGYVVVREEALISIKAKIDMRLNNWLCEMKPDMDDSIVGFNEAWDIVRKVFSDVASASTEYAPPK